MPLQVWEKGKYPDGMAALPDSVSTELLKCAEALAILHTALEAGSTVSEWIEPLERIQERLDSQQLICARVTALVAQQDIEQVRMEISDLVQDLSMPEPPLESILVSILSAIGDLSHIIEGDGKP